MRLVVFGAGYVGLVSGTGLSDLGHDVFVYDIDPDKIAKLEDGKIPIYEPGLADLVHRNQRNGRLHFGTSIKPPFDAVDAYFIAVGTPPDANGAADLSFVMAAADTIAKIATKKAVVVVKSTVPVGTCDKVQARLALAKVDLEVVSNPEFLKEGDAVNDFFKPDRVVVGARTDEARQMLRDLYAPLQLSGERLVMTDPRSSELIKYAANTMLAIRISFMNELSRLCHATGADIHAVRAGVGSDSRIGKKFLYAGPGYGGSCFPKDVQALAALGRENGVPIGMAEAAHAANEEQAHFLAELVEQALEGGLKGKHIALWGLAFKPETDDIREAPSVKLANVLLAKGATVCGHDPEAGVNFQKHFGDKLVVKGRDYDALDGAHALVLLTEWRSYRAPSFADMRQRLAGPAPLVVDARNIWRPSDVIKAGLRYQGIGVAVSANGDRPSQIFDVMRLLVTGGVGFIGHHLTRALLARGDCARVLDDFSDAPYPARLKRLHAATLAGESNRERLEIVEGCITNRETVRRAVDGVDGVVHLAGLAGVRPSFANPARYGVVNVEGTTVLLDEAQRAGLELFAFASSSSVYGNSTPLPALEDAPAIAPESPYAATKRSSELLAAALAKKTPEMRCPALRFFTVYGPWQRPEMAITLWLRKILAGEPITVFGDGSMQRDFTHIDDIVRGVLAAVDRAPAGVRPYNLGSGAPITLTDLVAAMGRASGKEPRIERAPVPLGDVDATFADISRAKSELAWEPRVRIDDGLATVVDWLRTAG